MDDRDRDLARRVAWLERENRRLKRAGALAALVLAGLGLTAQTFREGRGGVMDAEKVRVQDARGQTRIELSVLPDGAPTLGFLDRDGTPRAILGLSPDGAPGLVLLDAREKARLTLSVRADGAAAVALVDAGGRSRAMLDLAADGTPGLTFLDREGKARAVLGVMADGQLFIFPGGR